MQHFGTTPGGQDVSLFTLENASGARADITNYGGIVTRLLVPDRAGVLADVVLGHNSLAEYTPNLPYLGAIIGRFGNRIAHGQFTLEGKSCTLATNNTPGGVPCHLHGGMRGFDKVVWIAEPATLNGEQALRLSYTSRDGEEGYPGTLQAGVTYTLTSRNELRLDYVATTDKPTHVNLTNHSYFNLRGEGEGDILGHVATIHASHYLSVNAGLIPTGELAPVKDTPFDFTSPHRIGERIDAPHAQIQAGCGYDHTWVLDRKSDGLFLAAKVVEPVSGRTLETWTTEPGVQFYTGNFLDGKNTGKRGTLYHRRTGFCLETQHYPDSPNQPAFPTTVLRPGQTFTSTTIYRFGVE